MISIDGSLIIIIAIIGFLIFALNRLFFRPVQRVMEERERRISGPQQEAKRILDDHDKQLASLQAATSKARREANLYKAQFREKAREESEKVVEASNTEGRQRLERESALLGEQKKHVRNELTAHIQTLANKIAGHFVRG